MWEGRERRKVEGKLPGKLHRGKFGKIMKIDLGSSYF